MDTYYNVLILLVVSSIPGGNAGTACSAANRTSNLQDCLSQILSHSVDKDLFWFGTRFSQICPRPDDLVIDCRNPVPGVEDSLISRLFFSSGIDNNLVKKYINVNFTSPAGSYSGCGNTWTTEEESFTVDPLSDEVHHPWQTRMQPTITWEADEGKLYTLIIYDVAVHIAHGSFVNIEGGDLSEAEAILNWRGPLNPGRNPNVYTFLLFEQAERVNVSDDWRTKLTTLRASYNLTDVKKEFKLTGPVGLTWFLANADAYSIQNFLTRNVLNNCPLLYTRALWDHERFFAARNLVNLPTTLSITYTAPALRFASCCNTYTYSAKTFQPNPLGDALTKCGDVRSAVAPSVDIIKRTYMADAYTFGGTLYTLLMIDPDVQDPEFGTLTEPLLHWQIINIPNGTVDDGEVVQGYVGPTPNDNVTHTYYYLLYEQKKKLDANDMNRYVGTNCPESVTGRCLFNFALFVLENANQIPQGANWIRAEVDEYTKYHYIKEGSEEEDVCAGVTGYEIPCPVKPTDGAERSTSMHSLLYFVSIVTVLCVRAIVCL